MATSVIIHYFEQTDLESIWKPCVEEGNKLMEYDNAILSDCNMWSIWKCSREQRMQCNKCNQCKYVYLWEWHLSSYLGTYCVEESNKSGQCDFPCYQTGKLRKHFKMLSGGNSNQYDNVFLVEVWGFFRNAQWRIFEQLHPECKMFGKMMPL